MSSSIVPEPEPEDVTLPTAEIIPFPTRPQPVQAQQVEQRPVELRPEEQRPEELRPEDRLARALASLNEAMAEQKAAVAAWREALGALQASTNGLGGSLRRYQASLGTLGSQVADLHDRSVTMEQWAEGVLAKTNRDAPL